MRTAIGIVLIVLGLPLLVAGGAAAVYVGPDDTVEFVEENVASDASVMSTTPLFDVAGPTIHVAAESGDTEIFVGAAHQVHVESYLADVTRQTVSEVDINGELTSSLNEGEKPVPDAAPEGLGWWQHSASGAGEQSISFELTEQPTRIVITQAAPEGPLAVDLAVGAEISGVFITAVLIGVAGLLLLVGGVLLIRSARRRRRKLRAADSPPADAEPDDTPADSRPADDAAGANGADSADSADGVDEADGDVIPLHGRPAPAAPPPPPEPPRPTARISVLAGLGGVGALVTGCAQIPEQVDDSARDTTIEAITPDAADDFFAHYTETNNAANAERDRELIGTIETGGLLETSRFAYDEQEARGGDPFEPFTVTPSSVAAPRLGEYPLWSFVATESDNSETGSWYLLTRDAAASPWLARRTVHPEEGVAIPQPISEDGSAVVADDEAVEQGTAVLEELTAYSETGTEPENVDLSNAGGVSRLPGHGLKLDDAPSEFGSFDRRCELREPEQVHWLTTEFGAMTLATIECTQTMDANRGYSVIVEGEGFGLIPGGAEIVDSSITQSVSFVLSVDSDGSATVVGGAMRPTAMDHTEA